jgi:hypothetical protein
MVGCFHFALRPPALFLFFFFFLHSRGLVSALGVLCLVFFFDSQRLRAQKQDTSFIRAAATQTVADFVN